MAFEPCLHIKGENLKLDDKPKNKSKKSNILKLVNWKWVLTITVLSFFISLSMSYISSEALSNVNNIIAFLILLLFIAIGIIFDVIGMAATSATEKEFHSMAARKVSGAKEAVWLSRNANQVSSFCNDVVGDISGIISGATGAIIISKLTAGMAVLPTTVISLTITGLVASLTIGGKAIGKGFAIGFSVPIVFTVGRVLSVLPIRFDKK